MEVHKKASQEVIEKAYKVLIKKYRPDLYVGEEKEEAEMKSKDITEAYKVLSDQFLREQYNIELEKEMQANQSYSRINTRNQKSKENNVYKKKHTSLKNNNEQPKEKIKKEKVKEEKKYKHGSFGAIAGLTKSVFSDIPKIKIKKDIQREDKIAAGLTFIIVVVIGLILWFIPATNGFIRSMIPF